MRLMSFSMTVDAFLDGRKTVTRRLGWKTLKPGERLVAVEKAQGLKKGEKVRRLGEIEVVDVRRERLDALEIDEVGRLEVAREGFDLISPTEFVHLFAKANGCRTDAHVTRIEFRRVAS